MDAGSGSGGGETSIHITALDGIVNVNSLFTLAVFLGLTWNPSDPASSFSGSGSGGRCAPQGNKVGEDMVTFHVLSFSSFLFSSLVALCIKQAIRIHSRHINDDRHYPHSSLSDHRWVPRRFAAIGAERVNRAVLRVGILASAVGSVFGCGFLMLALVNVVQIKLGRVDCSGASVAAIVPLVLLVPAAMIIYSSVVFYAFTR